MKLKLRNTSEGFTITECLLVLFLLSVIGCFTLPSAIELMARQQAESYMRELRQTLNLARVKAVSENQLITVCPQSGQQCSADWTQLPIVVFSGEPSATMKIWRTIQSPPTNHQLRYNRPLLQFRSDGSLNTLQNGTFRYCLAEYPWHLTLSFSQAGRSQTTIEPTPCS